MSTSSSPEATTMEEAPPLSPLFRNIGDDEYVNDNNDDSYNLWDDHDSESSPSNWCWRSCLLYCPCCSIFSSSFHLPESLASPLLRNRRYSRTNSSIDALLHPPAPSRSLLVEVSRRIIMVGVRKVGKTSLVRRLTFNSFDFDYEPTIETTLRTLVHLQHICFKLEIVDMAGSDDIFNLGRHALNGVHGYCLVFSTTSMHSFTQVMAMHSKLVDLVGNNVKCVLVGTKADLTSKREVANEQELRHMAHQAGRMPYIECSSKTGAGVKDMIEALLFEIDGQELLAQPLPPSTDMTTHHVHHTSEKPKSIATTNPCVIM